MFALLFVVSTIIPLACFVLSVRKVGFTFSALSHFWYFSFIWFVSYPINALIVYTGAIRLPRRLDAIEPHLALALFVALLLWVCTYLGYLSVPFKLGFSTLTSSSTRKKNWLRGALLLGVSLLLLYHSLNHHVFVGGQYLGMKDRALEVSQSRVGHGLLTIFSGIYIFVAIAALGHAMARPGRHFLLMFEKFTFAAVIAVSAFMMVAVTSRRFLLQIMVALVVVYVVKRRWKAPLLALAVVAGTAFFAPVFQAIRYMDLMAVWEGTQTFGDQMLYLFDFDYWVSNVFSSFESITHLAAFIALDGWEGLIGGIDYGNSWLYHIGLGYFPRSLWADKPLHYGSIAQQLHLYPEMFFDRVLPATLPPGIAVDFLYGFGILGALILSYFLGRFLRVLSVDLWDPSNLSGPSRAIALYTFVIMFNLVRGGSAYIFAIIPFVVMVAAVYGVSDLLVAVRSLVQRVFSRSSTVVGARLAPVARKSNLARGFSDGTGEVTGVIARNAL